MNIKLAAKYTSELIDGAKGLARDDPETGRQHLHVMAAKIVSGEVTGEKAHRWLGWMQACIVLGDGSTLKEMKEINATV
jgi:hypothetical protein